MDQDEPTRLCPGGARPVLGLRSLPTGPYHKAFEAALGEKLPLVKVNPLQARRFAEAYGTRARTDAVPSRRLETNRLPGNRGPDVGAHGGGVRLTCPPTGLLADQPRKRHNAQKKQNSIERDTQNLQRLFLARAAPPTGHG